MVNTPGTNSLDTLALHESFHLSMSISPGRFFAATELKTMLAHVVMSYDIKLEDNRIQSKELSTIFGVSPNPSATVMFRRRVL